MEQQCFSLPSVRVPLVVSEVTFPNLVDNPRCLRILSIICDFNLPWNKMFCVYVQHVIGLLLSTDFNLTRLLVVLIVNVHMLEAFSLGWRFFIFGFVSFMFLISKVALIRNRTTVSS